MSNITTTIQLYTYMCASFCVMENENWSAFLKNCNMKMDFNFVIVQKSSSMMIITGIDGPEWMTRVQKTNILLIIIIHHLDLSMRACTWCIWLSSPWLLLLLCQNIFTMGTRLYEKNKTNRHRHHFHQNVVYFYSFYESLPIIIILGIVIMFVICYKF